MFLKSCDEYSTYGKGSENFDFKYNGGDIRDNFSDDIEVVGAYYDRLCIGKEGEELINREIKKYRHMGVLFSKQGNYEESEKSYLHILGLALNYSAHRIHEICTYVVLSRLYCQRGKYEKAQIYLDLISSYQTHGDETIRRVKAFAMQDDIQLLKYMLVD